MGSFLDSNFSLDVVTESPWDTSQPTDYKILLCSGGSWHELSALARADLPETGRPVASRWQALRPATPD